MRSKTTQKAGARMVNELQLLSAFFMHTTEGIVVVDKQGKIVMANPQAEAMFAFPAEELLGESVEVLIPREASSRHQQHREQYYQSPRPRRMGAGVVLYAMRRDKTVFPVEISLSHVPADENEYTVCFIVDISERKRQQDAIREAHAELEQRVLERTEELRKTMEQLEESRRDVLKSLEKERELNRLKSRFVTTASHEFRTPLGTILSSAALISRYDNPGDEEKRHKHIDRIKSAVSQLNELLNEFLSLEKLEEGAVRAKPEWFDLTDYLKSIMDELQSLVKDGQQIVFEEVGDASSKVYMDKQLLRIIANNLISNAIKYSPAGAEIRIKARIGTESVSISFQDQGIGIPDEDKPYLFERFFRAHNATNIQGTGLGLNIVKRYAEVMSGTLSFTSVLNQGSVFTVTFPRD